MAKEAERVSKLSPAFMTGGGGENFERHVAAVFVLSLIIDGFAPVLNAPIKRLEFQAKKHGYDVDDFVVTAMRGKSEKRLLCQAKHDVAVTATNRTFQEVITAAWADFSKPEFHKNSDMIALVTGFIAKDSIDALRYLHEQANGCISAEEFTSRISQSGYTSKTRKEKFEAIRTCITNANCGMQPSDEDLWQFCRCFVLVVFDLDYEQSVNQVLIRSLIKCKANTDPSLVWSRISDQCGFWKQAAATIDRASIPENILELFGQGKPDETTMPVSPAFVPTASWAVAALVGCWNEKNDADILAIEKLTGTPYSVFQSECRQYLSTGMISLTNGQWKVVNRNAVMDAVRDLYFDNTLQAAFQIAGTYLKETSKQFTSDGQFGLLIPASGRFTNSEVFRKGLLDGLCLLVNGRRPAHCSEQLLEAESKELVRESLANADWTRLVSFGELILNLSELNPSTYLHSLERLIHHVSSEILQLFPKKNASITDQNFVTYLLFSLEQLAWHKDYLVQTVSCLSAMEALEYEETNWVNTPMNAMIGILNPYITQTAAPLEKIKHAIQAVKMDYTDVCWDLCCRLLSSRCVIGITNNSQPKFLMSTENCRAILTGEECDELREYYVQQALSMAGTEPERMSRIAKNLQMLAPNDRKTFLAEIRSAAISWNDEEKHMLWSKLTDRKLRIILDNDNKEPSTPEYAELCTTIDAVRPGSILTRYKRLFKFHYDDYSDGENRWEKKERQKQEAVVEIYRTYGIQALMEFGESLNASYDVGYRLGQQLTTEELVSFLPMCKVAQQEVFCSNVINAFFRKNGTAAINEIEMPREDTELIAFVLRHVPFTQELIDLIPVYLPGKEAEFWGTVRIPSYYSRHADFDVISVVHTLMEHQRTPAAISLLGDAVNDLQPDPKLVCDMLVQAPSEQKLEKIDPDATRELIGYLQETGKIDVKTLSQIEFFYLVWLDDRSEVRPKAIEYLLANESSCFCELMAAAYKKRHADSEKKALPKAVSDRIFQITFQYRVVPGTDWDGNFHRDVFENWMKEVVEWSRENDRFEVSMHTVGGALSYVAFDEAGLIDVSIMAELNKPESDELRKGYQLGAFNQRGVHWVDPEGKPEKELAAQYIKRAEAVESLGYSRFAGLLRDIATGYLKEAEDNIRRFARDQEEE